MLKIRAEGRFKKDVKKLTKSGSKDMEKLRGIIRKLERGIIYLVLYSLLQRSPHCSDEGIGY
jgi:mRNA-degrading endonuclease YafQ of YafQ-DinJ toxin-antitoxin module